MDALEIAADHIEGGHDLVRGLDTRRVHSTLRIVVRVMPDRSANSLR